VWLGGWVGGVVWGGVHGSEFWVMLEAVLSFSPHCMEMPGVVSGGRLCLSRSCILGAGGGGWFLGV
jgi:hypothetical protein